MNKRSPSVGTPADKRLIAQIATRARTLYKTAGVKRPAIQIIMDLHCVHNHIVPLRLAEMLDGPDSHFMHDVDGIGWHLDRERFVLKHCFLPRYSARVQS